MTNDNNLSPYQIAIEDAFQGVKMLSDFLVEDPEKDREKTSGWKAHRNLLRNLDRFLSLYTVEDPDEHLRQEMEEIAELDAAIEEQRKILRDLDAAETAEELSEAIAAGVAQISK